MKASQGTADVAHAVTAGRQLAAMGFIEDLAIATTEDGEGAKVVFDGMGPVDGREGASLRVRLVGVRGEG
ncbi:hypothetical protein ACWDA7_43745 [Streptomyces sp. NPDC001156]